MIRALSAIGILALTGCAAGPPVSCQAPVTAQSTALATNGYALAGKVISALSADKIPGAIAIRLNGMLQQAQADLRAGKVAEAQALFDSVEKALP